MSFDAFISRFLIFAALQFLVPVVLGLLMVGLGNILVFGLHRLPIPSQSASTVRDILGTFIFSLFGSSLSVFWPLCGYEFSPPFTSGPTISHRRVWGGNALFGSTAGLTSAFLSHTMLLPAAVIVFAATVVLGAAAIHIILFLRGFRFWLEMP